MLPAVPLAKPSHCAAPCAGFVVWPIAWHRQKERSYGKNERRAQARNTMVWPIAPILSHFVTIAPFNAIGIWATTLLAYGQQRQRDMTNNGGGICGKTHKGMLRMILISSSTPVLLKTILILSSTPVLQYACTIENDSHSHGGK
jgi:hypothetical protein